MTGMTPEQQREWRAWLSGRPQIVREVATAFPPFTCYTINETGQHATIYSYSEDGTVTVDTHMSKLAPIPLQVFGIDPASLTVCGCILTPAEGRA